MGRMISILFVLALLASAPENVTEFDLDNGIHVISRTVTGGEVEGLSFFLVGGSRVLNESNQGIEAFALEAALTGSDTYPDQRWREIMDVTLASWNASYNYDYSRYHLKCLSEDLPLLLHGFADCLLEPELDPVVVGRVQNSQLIALQSDLNDPDNRIWLVANKGFMGAGHPYLLRPDGIPSTLSSFDVDDAREWLSSRIKSGNIVITHAGPTPPEQLEELLENSFGRIPEGGDVFPQVPEFGVYQDTMVAENDETLSAYVVVKFKAPPVGSEDAAAYSTAMGVVDEMLWQVLRTENALTYAVYGGSTSSYQRNWGYMYISTTEPVLSASLMAGVFSDVVNGNVDQSVVTGVANNNRTRQGINAQSMDTQCWMLGSGYISTGNWQTPYLLQESLENMTVYEISRALTDWAGDAGWGIIADSAIVDFTEFEPWSLKGE
ncbi:MAG: insulinase family protein [Candidatus Sabulitectum sp.]|nr:insulinase family protein [Candidatus Sabulitectum sp.]